MSFLKKLENLQEVRALDEEGEAMREARRSGTHTAGQILRGGKPKYENGKLVLKQKVDLGMELSKAFDQLKQHVKIAIKDGLPEERLAEEFMKGFREAYDDTAV